MLTTEERAALEAAAKAATPGPWFWAGYSNGSIELRANPMGKRIITTMRSRPCIVTLANNDVALTDDACSACKTYYTDWDELIERESPCEHDENLDTVYLWDERGFVSPANKWAVQQVTYRTDVARVDHPDAAYIALANPTAILDLLAENAALTRALRCYGQHEPGCALGEKFDRHSTQIIRFSSCDCGLSDALAELVGFVKPMDGVGLGIIAASLGIGGSK